MSQIFPTAMPLPHTTPGTLEGELSFLSILVLFDTLFLEKKVLSTLCLKSNTVNFRALILSP